MTNTRNLGTIEPTNPVLTVFRHYQEAVFAPEDIQYYRRLFFILKVSPEQRPYEDAFQLYSYCNREREVPE